MNSKQINYFYLLILSFLFLSACEKDHDIFEDKSDIVPTDTIKITPVATDTLHVSDSARIEFKKLFTLNKKSTYNQGFAIYDNLLFNCHHSNDIIDIYNIENGKELTSISLDPDPIIHCNNVNFGPNFYSDNDKFPLLYVQQRGYANKLNAYRIIVNNDTIFSAQKLQTISFTPCSDSITAIDVSNNLIYVIYKINNKWYISPIDIPHILDEDITVIVNLASETYYLPFTKVIQDTACSKDYLYYVCGYAKQGELWRIDMKTKKAKVIDFTQFGLNSEPEGLEFYNNQLYVSFVNNTVYKISILD